MQLHCIPVGASRINQFGCTRAHKRSPRTVAANSQASSPSCHLSTLPADLRVQALVQRPLHLCCKAIRLLSQDPGDLPSVSKSSCASPCRSAAWHSQDLGSGCFDALLQCSISRVEPGVDDALVVSRPTQQPAPQSQTLQLPLQEILGPTQSAGGHHCEHRTCTLVDPQPSPRIRRWCRQGFAWRDWRLGHEPCARTARTAFTSETPSEHVMGHVGIRSNMHPVAKD